MATGAASLASELRKLNKLQIPGEMVATVHDGVFVQDIKAGDGVFCPQKRLPIGVIGMVWTCGPSPGS